MFVAKPILNSPKSLYGSVQWRGQVCLFVCLFLFCCCLLFLGNFVIAIFVFYKKHEQMKSISSPEGL